MSCPHINSCSLFPLFSMRESLRVWQISFCQTHHEKCQRFIRSEAGQPVPPNLLPNGTELPTRKGTPSHGK